MNRDGHPMGLGWLSLILFGLSFVVPPDAVISGGRGATRLAEPDVLHGPAAIATALGAVAFGTFLMRQWYFAFFLAVPGFLIALQSVFPWIWGLHVGMILWVGSMLGLALAAYRCDAFRERLLHPHPTQKQ